MEKEKFQKILELYWEHSTLRETERSGWKKWNVSGRRESISDHSSSAQILALALYSELDELASIDIEHVITLLSIHEVGEARIGDITPYNGITPEEKAKMEREAVVSIFENLIMGKWLISLFDEFEAKETPEAKFAYLCDKLDCDLRAQEYSSDGRCSINTATYEIVSHPKVQEALSNGAKTVWEVFWESDKKIYKGTYLEEFFEFLKNLP